MGGTINVAGLTDSGVASPLGGTGTTVNFNGGTLNYTGPFASTNRTLNSMPGVASSCTMARVTFPSQGSLTGTGVLTKNGPGKA